MEIIHNAKLMEIIHNAKLMELIHVMLYLWNQYIIPY